MSERTKFIINTSADFFNVNATPIEDISIREFFENDEITILAATRNEMKIEFQHRLPTDEDCLIFYKVPQIGTGQSSDEPTLGLLTLQGGMVKSIYNSMSRVFSPFVSKGTEYGPELSGLLENLHVSLGSTLGLPQTGIRNIQDEINFWNQNSTNSSTKSDREKAQMFATLLNKINKKIKQIDQNTLNMVEEFLDSAHNNLDEIWRLPYHYPQDRMADLMDVICNQIIETCIENLMTEDVWNLSSYHINYLMNQVLDITDSWMQLCDSLTRLFWPNYGQHPWIGKSHIPKNGQLFKDRLGEIKNIKNLYKQIVTLLNDENFQNMFSWDSPFKSINIFETSSIGQKKWNRALNQFEQLLQPIDERIALAIKSQLHNHLNNPRQVIFIFSKYDTLISRPTVLELLTTEREQFLQSLHSLIQDLRKAMNDKNMEPDTGYLSAICNECRWLKIVQHQIHETEKITHLINDRNGFEEINKSLKELKEETNILLKSNFEIWTEQNLSAIKSGELKLREDQPVVQFEREGRQLMRVTFNPKLVSFCQDVGEFENLGYRVPIELRSSATHASKFMCYARRLQQISTFHNTIGDRMIPCQRPIMLKNAIELSKLVQSESVAWNDEESVKRYIRTLQAAVHKLANDNNLLVGYHEQAKQRIIKLMNTDLLSQGQIWKDEMRHLRELVANLESQGYMNLDAFKLHWDHQLYKVLEYQYIYGLIDMNNKLPDIYIDIIFRQQHLQFRPPEEEIRSKYFAQLRRIIERPLGFRGLSDKSSELFKVMVERNRHYFGLLFNKAEELFKKLTELKNIWLPWVALGCVDIEELCRVHLTKWEHWDDNFKACKHFSQQIAKIENSEANVDCFVINILPLKADIEFINRRYWEALASSLRTSILTDISTVQEFLQSSLQFLQNVPMDELGIAESGAKYERIKAEMPKVSEILETVKGKDKCLASWCKERVSALTGILVQWEKLQPLFENHSVVLQRQVEIMRDHVTTQLTNLKEEAEKFMLRWESTISELEANDGSSMVLFKERQQHWTNVKEKKEKLFEECAKFNMKIPDEIVETFSVVEEKVTNQGQQWDVYNQFLSEFEEVSNEEWTVYRRRPYIFTDFLLKWENSVNSSLDLPSSRIRQTIEHYHSALTVLQYLQADSLTERHWAKVFLLLKKENKPIHTICLKDLLSETGLLIQNSNEIQNLVRQASSEQIVRQALSELDQWSVTAMLKLIAHLDSSGNTISLIKDFQEVLNKIGDNQSLLQSAKNSAAFEAFSDQAEIWESRLNTLDSVLTSLNSSQRKWVYLEPVFGAGTLKNEEALFKRIDKDFRYIMREIENDPRVLSVIKINNITTVINSLENQLSRCQNTLISYIIDKRNSFPRFYFLGDDDLLEMLGQASKEDIIQKHIRKLFPGIHSLEINKINGINVINKINSSEGDKIQLQNPIEMKGPIENWLSQLVTSIQKTLQEQIKVCSQIQNLEEETILKYPMQCICTARSINFTKQTEKAITSMSLSTILKNLKEDISKYANLKNQTKNSLLQIKLRGLLLDLVHYVTVVEELIEKSVTRLGDWIWLQQIKFYMNSDSKVIIKMGFAEFDYSYEFLGNPNKLVHTTLTHKCYLTLTQAMHLGLGGNPFGPAGTGKTECVKALGGMMGRLVLVFNCDENVDTEAMGLILTGLAKCGAWGCFDEFNRLQEATLSAISMLIQPIQTALKDKNETVQILENSIKLNHHCGIFVTLNPAGEEYGGRQQLPGNIQALFRPIVMQQPEPCEISKVMLFVEGFKRADEIGNRIVELFALNDKILSAQRHYDWGLRELKTVLLACGKELRDKGSSSDEMNIVVDALRSNTMSKLNTADSQRFDMLLNNVFPEVQIDLNSTSNLRTAIEGSFVTLGLSVNNKQIEKCLQLYEQLIKRMGVVLVGPSCSGKTTILSVLKQALISTGKIIRLYTISPKSMNRVQLLGKLDPDTRQWSDGVLTTTAVAVNSEPLNVNSWIICDGDVDPEWIEALNSVLDDNKLLTLPSGWRIQFGNNVNFIFETHDLSYASPATISRMGIINLSSEDLDENVIIEAALAKNEQSDLLRPYIEQYMKPAIEWTLKEMLSSISRICLIKSGLQMITKSQNKDEFCVNLLQAFLGYIPTEKHNKFANQIMELANIYITNPKKSEYCYFNSFRDVIELYDTDMTMNLTNPDIQLIQTDQIKSYLEIIRNFLKTSLNPFIISGPSGCGKTLLIQQVSAEFSGYQLVIINCSTQLTPKYILYSLKQNCITISGIRGREYKPQQLRIILFLKNIDLCFTDSWNTSHVIELIIQLIQRGGFYSDNLEWISIYGIQICASLSNINKQTLSSRYLSINNYLNVKYPSQDDMRIIVQNQLQSICDRFKNVSNTQLIVNGLIQFFTKIQQNFTQDQHSHYNFTPKMITNLLKNLKNYSEDMFKEALLTEINSQFRNRLANNEDIQEYDRILSENLKQISTFHEKSEIFFIPKGPQNSELISLSYNEWKEMIQKHITTCNTESFFIQGPITDELLIQTSSISRFLSRPNTHIVLVGRPGSRRTDSIYISATILSSKVVIPQGIRNYSINDFYNDLKLAMQSAALEDQSTILLINHSWLMYLPEIMKPIEAILEGSEIIDLFGDDLESIASPLKTAAQLEDYQESLAAYFLQRVKKNLHLIITLDSSSENLDEFFNTYPTLYRSAELIWIQSPSVQTYSSLPKSLINLISKEGGEDVPIPKYLSMEMLISNTRSPIKFYQLIQTYYNLFCSFNKSIKKQLEKLKTGVDKLLVTHKVVANLKTNASEQEIALAEKRKLANEALEMISATMRNANDQKSDLLELKKKTQENSEKLKERKTAIELELKDVEPILKEATAAVGQIKTDALSEIRSLRAPPEAIRDILEGVLRLMGIRDTSWNSMKTFLAKRGVKEDIRSLDPSRISPENCDAVERLLRAKSDSFDVRNAKRASIAAAPLAAWVIANVRYSKVTQSIKPLEREQNELQKNLDMAEGQMKSLSSGLDDVDSRVKELSGQLNVYTQEAAVLELKLDEARNTLKSAEILVEKLNSEFQNWNNQLQDYEKSYKTLDLKSFLLSLVINYYPNFSYEERSSTLNLITNELQISKFNITGNLISEQDQIIWESMGLTRDVQAIENAALLTKLIELPFGTTQIPLLIDPHENGFHWLQEYLQVNNKSFEITSQDSPKFTYSLELAVRFGKILLIHDCQEIQPPLLEIIFINIYSKFNKKLLQVGNKLIDLEDNFRLILISKFTKIKFQSEMNEYIAMLPFTITVAGLTDQLMSKTILLKKPQLEEKRINLLKNEGNLLKQRIELEDKLLEELSQSQGDILKNEKLLKTLTEVKESSEDITKSLKDSSAIKMNLLQEYNQYQNLCSKISNFYIGLNKRYEISVPTFIGLFLKSLENNDETDDDEKIYLKLIRISYQYICRSTPKNEHLTLGMYICRNAFPEQIRTVEWELFVTNFLIGDDKFEQTLPNWIKKEYISKVLTLKSNLPEIFDNMQLENEELWRKYIETKENHDINIKVSLFQKVLITQIFRPDKLSLEMSTMIYKMIGIKLNSFIQPTFEQLTQESSKINPILIITETGNDPSDGIKEYALKKHGNSIYMEISIGKGMEKVALEKVREAAQNGKWICIKNVHLVTDWLSNLNRELETIECHERFRLWLICDSIKNFPNVFLYKCIKILFESPSGLKNKIKRLISQWSSTILAQTKDSKLIKLYIGLFILNSVLQERRNYIPQGWSKWYEFGDSDLRAAIELLKWLDKGFGLAKIEWPILQGLCEHLAYGGRINNRQDLEILVKHLEEFFNDNTISNRWSPLELGITIPMSNNLQDYYETIEKLPDHDMPERFGLSFSSSIAKEVALCRNVIKSLRGSYYQEEQSSTEKRIRPILSLWKKLATNCTIVQTCEKMIETKSQNPWQAFLISEIKLGGQLFKEIHRTLVHLHTIIKEMKSLSNQTKTLVNSLAENQVPLSWRKIWSGPKSSIDYIKSVIFRCTETEQRYKNDLHLDFINDINLTSTFIPEAFFSALKLINSNDLKKSSSDMILNSSILQISGKYVVKISSLIIDGANFNGGKLVITNKNITLGGNQSPEFYVTYIDKTILDNVGTIQIPLYTNISREKFICTLSVMTNETVDAVLLSGAALIVPELIIS